MSSADGYCRHVLVLHPGDVMPRQPCIECGHALLAHIGVEHCPICELVALAEQHRVEVVPVEESPKPGDRLHLWSSKLGCLPGTVERPMVFGPGLLIKIDGHDFPFNPLVADAPDESRRVNGSWHWPCDSATQDADPKPEAPAPMAINVTVQCDHVTDQRIRQFLQDKRVMDGLVRRHTAPWPFPL